LSGVCDFVWKLSFGILIVEQKEFISNHRLIRLLVGRLFRGVLRLQYSYSFSLFFFHGVCFPFYFVGG
jgi:hypothetical protein